MSEELAKWIALQTDIRISLAAVQKQLLELLNATARQMEESLQTISVVIQELKEKEE